jgi:CelD/BcsL family acetyltransferase involved in cellulose biosynthesis
MHRQLDLIDARDPGVESIWRTLEADADATYFLSWPWVANWLALLPRELRLDLAVIREDDRAVAACFVGRARVTRQVVACDALFLNATGTRIYDELCVEHNGLLARRDTRVSLAELLTLLPGDWHELQLPAIDAEAFGAFDHVPGYRLKIDKEAAAPYIDLAAVRAAKDGYVSLLGSSTRSQLRRARRAVGDVTLDIAQTEQQATEIFDEMLVLHAKRWNAKGLPGAFAEPWFEQFHRKLIADRLPHGEIQLVRARTKNGTLGCLYNFVYRGRILFYQSGLEAFEDAHVKPGFLAHAAAIEHNATAGHEIYDLLGGDARYKQQLATATARLVWARVQRPLVRFSVEDRLRAVKRAIGAALRPT